jgi:hypothetical protein
MTPITTIIDIVTPATINAMGTGLSELKEKIKLMSLHNDFSSVILNSHWLNYPEASNYRFICEQE